MRRLVRFIPLAVLLMLGGRALLPVTSVSAQSGYATLSASPEGFSEGQTINLTASFTTPLPEDWGPIVRWEAELSVIGSNEWGSEPSTNEWFNECFYNYGTPVCEGGGQPYFDPLVNGHEGIDEGPGQTMQVTDYVARGTVAYDVAMCLEFCWAVERPPVEVESQLKQVTPIPRGDATEMVGWADPPETHYRAWFEMTLLGGNFTGRMVREVEGSSQDTCHFPMSEIAEAHLDGTVWPVGSNNKYDYDEIGWTAQGIHYYLGNTGPMVQAPCGFSALQSMQIDVPTGWSTYYVVNVEARIEVDPSRVTVTRDTKSGEKMVF